MRPAIETWVHTIRACMVVSVKTIKPTHTEVNLAAHGGGLDYVQLYQTSSMYYAIVTFYYTGDLVARERVCKSSIRMP